MKTVFRKLCLFLIWCGIGIVVLPLLLYGIYMAGYEYTFYRNFKTVHHIKSLHRCTPWNEPFAIELPVNFSDRRHDRRVVQKLIVQAENRKCFMILRFEDEVVQLMAFPFVRYLGLKYYRSAYYDITDRAAREKLYKLLDECREEVD